MIRLTRKASVWMRLGQPLGHGRVRLADQGLGQQPEGAHGGLQLVADVGHEVAADLLEAPALGDVVDDGDHPEGAPPVVDQLRSGRARVRRGGP